MENKIEIFGDQSILYFWSIISCAIRMTYGLVFAGYESFVLLYNNLIVCDIVARLFRVVSWTK